METIEPSASNFQTSSNKIVQTQKPSLSKEIEKLSIIDEKVEETILTANLPIDSKEKNSGEKMASLKPQNLPSTQVLFFQEGQPSDAKIIMKHKTVKKEKKRRKLFLKSALRELKTSTKLFIS